MRCRRSRGSSSGTCTMGMRRRGVVRWSAALLIAIDLALSMRRAVSQGRSNHGAFQARGRARRGRRNVLPLGALGVVLRLLIHHRATESTEEKSELNTRIQLNLLCALCGSVVQIIGVTNASFLCYRGPMFRFS